MRSVGVLILIAGIGVALFVYLPAPVDSGPSFNQVQRIAPRAAQLSPTKFTPFARLSAFAAPIELSIAQAQRSWQTTVVVAAPAPTPKTLSPTDPDARYKLVLDIQQQLKRVGCYWGRMNGSWGLATKGAMKEFTDRINGSPTTSSSR
jgi:hypothetical protein